MNKSLSDINLTLLNVGYANLGTNWNFKNVLSPFCRIYYIISGEARVHENDRTLILKPDYLYLIPSYTFHGYSCDERMEQYFIHILEEVGSGLSIFNLKNFDNEVPANILDKGLFERLLEINPNRGLLNDDPKNYDNRNSMLNFADRNENISTQDYLESQGILRMLLSRFIAAGSAEQAAHPVKSKKIIDTLYYISANIADDLSVAALAQHNFMNADYFSRLFIYLRIGNSIFKIYVKRY